ncbi:YbaB/EbfC family nucleoid-associated protein [Rhizobiales bacterium TNE-4]|nr:YbaB/EbfC family nucleoid-associated protein [Rhizobiales bacterium TNE-4]MBV1826079.1 YbaB/EbfC family nucleoid-associated protein [Rhizobiales bacterium TNE-4]
MKDMFGMMKQVQAMQQKMADMQAELEALEVDGASGGGMVRVTATAKGQVKNIAIDDSLMKADEKDILEDLIVAAINDAKGKGEALMQERMQKLTAGLPIPPGLKLF